ncbi:hypothetical protein G7067_13160 [Leucobacter insecticola]|uniref:Tetratricopeptide repeat protein n=1 Tax=Leucobacter insecticola TaxID=2714934 RepID=A0A6G8FM29_9MICO|nr:hypothetical protein [Leucobacter insecticola]QIM17142.1 hypothetical protein G7067_13160 [Leucobacter insecticola]
MFRRLSLTDGGFATMDLVAVLSGLDVLRAEAVVRELGELSIVEVDEHGRVRVDGFVGVFARMQLKKDPDAEAARELADRYLLSGIAAAGWWFKGYSTMSVGEEGIEVRHLTSFEGATEWLLAEGECWPAALLRAQIAGRHRLVVVLISHLHWFAQLWPHRQAWIELWQLAAKSAEVIGDKAQFALLHDELAGFLIAYRRDAPAAARALDVAEQAAAELEGPRYLGWNYFLRAGVALELGEYARGLRYCDDALQEMGDVTVHEPLLYTRMARAELLVKLGRHDEAMQELAEVRGRIAELDLPVPRMAELFLVNLARIAAESYRARGDLKACVAACTGALEGQSHLQGHPVLAEILMARGSAHRDLGEEAAAARDFFDTENLFVSATVFPELSA